MINKTEEEIMQNWESRAIPTVSIACVVFNHEKYIEQTLDSFLAQETNFSFEVLIHDDVSNDGTIVLIEKYRAKYPNIIKPLYQDVNQYSEGKNPLGLLFPEVKGEYMAVCDGDDYWTDTQKLQIQIDEMKRYPWLDMSFHYASELMGGKRCQDFGKQAREDKIFTTQEVILGGGEFCATSALVFKSGLLNKVPSWFFTTMVGDYPIQVLGAASGKGALYIHKNMSIYRVGEAGSWTNALQSTENSYKQLCAANKFLNQLDETLEKQYSRAFAHVISKKNFAFLCKTSFPIEYREKLYKEFEHTLTAKQKLIWRFVFSKIRVSFNIPSPRSIKLKVVRWFC